MCTVLYSLLADRFSNGKLPRKPSARPRVIGRAPGRPRPGGPWLPAMVVAYVRLYGSAPAAVVASRSEERIYALILPDSLGVCDEVDVRQSEIAGLGVFPTAKWPTSVPALLPYLGMQTFVADGRTLKVFIKILQGDFERLTVGDAERLDGRRFFVADALFAVPRATSSLRALPAPTRLLCVHSSHRYIMEEEVRCALHLTGARAHLFEQLARGTPLNLTLVLHPQFVSPSH